MFLTASGTRAKTLRSWGLSPGAQRKERDLEANYINHWTTERQDTGAANNHVCLFTASSEFKWMGYSVRSDGWRYTVWVAWSGAILKVLNVKPARATHGQSID